MTFDIVHHPEQDGLPIDEALRRLVTAFPRVTVDRDKGKTMRKGWGSNCGSYVKHDPKKYAKEMNAAWILVTEGSSNVPLEFVLENHMEFFIKYDSEEHRKQRRPALQTVADALGYTISEWSLFVDVRLVLFKKPFEAAFSIADELTLHAKLSDALSKIGFYAEEVDFTVGDIGLSVSIRDESKDKVRVEEAVWTVLPDAKISFSFRPDSLPRCL